ncbi:MAG: T9SS type A sorting domain-containing protein, partial [Bacteroidales bacterium]|nr:T9SS type A sorting domain-containing protein [Bacteroidales bacterium]
TPVWFAFHSDDGGGWASGWAIDNVFFANGETEPVAYHVYLDGSLDGVTDTTFYQYEYLTYGVTYTASVAAQYSCGLSDEIYYTFTSIFLLPPRNLDGLTFDHTVHLWWEPPITPTDVITDNSVFDPNFVAVTEEADFVGTTIDPVGYKPLASTRALLYDNGPLVNSVGTGTGGADESVLQAGLGTYGFGCQYPLDYRIADDFEVVGTTWTVDEIVVYGYQTNSGPPSSFVGCYLQIYDGDPSSGGTVIWGDQVTNVLTSTDWTGIYRVNAVGGGSARPIMYLACATTGLSLPAGVYWLEYSLDGSGSSGPWTPPVTIDGMLATGNALQFTGSWGPAMDGSYQQDFPFLFNGDAGGSPGGVVPENFIGYNLYRDFNNIAYIPYTEEDTTHYFDMDLQPLCYEYDVTAVYDLTPYGFPGETAESMYEGPFDICVEYGWPLAFVEDWNTGSFDPNLWNHGDNWVVNGQFGNPLPCAEFTWDPVLNDYKSALTSYPIDGKYHPGTTDAYIDGRIFFDFDISLVDNGMSGDEKINVEVWDDGNWYSVATFSNADGNFDWTSYHFEISDHAFGKIFKVRFQAEGVNSSGILSWFVDNIHLYRECDAPTDLIATADPDYDENQIFLSWTPPASGGGTVGGDWITWDNGVHFGGVGLTGGGVFSVASHWDADQITAYEGMYITNIRFVPYINAVTTSFTLKVWEGADAGTLVYEEAVSGLLLGEWNDITLATPVAIDHTQELWFGYTVDSPDGENPAGRDEGPAVAGYGDMISLDGVAWDPLSVISTIDGNWNIQAYVASTDGAPVPMVPIVDNTVYSTPNASPVALEATSKVGIDVTGTRALTGYNVYWNDDGAGYNFLEFTEDTTYLHEVETPFVVGSLQCYYVTAVFEDCEPESNEACWIATGIEDPAIADGISVYPNPARDILNITSSTDITHVTVMNYVGQVVYNQKVVEDNDLQLNVAGYETGVYMVKVETTAGILIKKVTIAH